MKSLGEHLRYFILIGLFIIPFVPLIVTGSLYFPFITGKAFAFRIIVECIAAAWLILALSNKEYRPKFSLILGFFTVFVVTVGLADLLGADQYRSLWSNSERMEGFVGLLHMFVYFIVAVSVLNTQKLWEYLFKTSIWVSVIVSFYSLAPLIEYFKEGQGGIRLESTLGNAIYLAAYVLFHIFLAMFFFIRSRTTGMRVLYSGIVLLHLLILFYTGTRGTALGLVVGVLVSTTLVAIFARKYPWSRKIAGGVLLVVILCIGGFYSARNSEFVQSSSALSRFANVSLTDGTGNARLIIWGVALDGVRERPILGWGQENFTYVFSKYYDPALVGNESWFDRTHNVVLDWFIAGGVVGVTFYLSLFASALYLLWKGRTDLTVIEKALFTGLLVGYFVHNLFVFDNNVSYILFISILGYIHIQSDREWIVSRAMVVDSKSLMRIGVPIVAIVLVAMLYVVNFKPIVASQSLIMAMRNNSPSLSSNYGYFTRVFKYDTFVSAEATEQMSRFVQGSVVSSGSVPASLKKDFRLLAEQQIDNQIVRTPNDARSAVFAGNYYRGIGELEQAIKYLERAHKLSPKKPDILIELGMTYRFADRKEETLDVFKQAYELNTEYPLAQMFYGAALIDAGQKKEGEELIESIDKDFYYTDSNAITVLTLYDLYEYVVDIFLEKISRSPNDMDLKASLVTAYLKAGKEAEAIKYLEYMGQEYPELKNQLEVHIERIRSGELGAS